MTALACIRRDEVRDAILHRKVPGPFRALDSDLARLREVMNKLTADGVDAQVLACHQDHQNARNSGVWAHAYVMPNINVDVYGRVISQLWLACGDQVSADHVALAEKIAARLRQAGLADVEVRPPDPTGATITILTEH